MAAAGSKDLYTILFADISGSTTLYEKMGDTLAQYQIGDRLEKIAGVVTTHQGKVIKTIGDEIMCRFETPAEALRASCEIHKLMQCQTDVNGVVLSTRIGIHHGPAILKDNDLFGDAVNVAARVTSLAKARQTLTTETTVAALSADTGLNTRQLDQAHVKGKQEALVLHEVIWEQENLTVLATSYSSLGAAERIVLRYGETTKVVERNNAGFTIGRDPSCQLQLLSSIASRLHGKIEYRGGKFLYVDNSANGTYVRSPELGELFLRREELPLFGSGIIACGEKINDESPHLIRFSCE
ncbi:MAG TPA: adenylate/guanylate cyclase domain-containing protein [Burkholderiales bacterium]|nr:adenylate/guanylate cyclase domain-containing protein [Burkholderiales bacterium]